MPIKNIIFDLGGVLINIDYNRTTQAFREIGLNNFHEMYAQYTANNLFENLETGKIVEGDFYAAIKKLLLPQITVTQIKDAWNKMLLNFRMNSLNFLPTLKNKYQIFLLSNTNSIHFAEFSQNFSKETGKKSLNDFFHKTYYSHLIGVRKPYEKAFEYVLNDAGIIPQETLFIDDSVNNIETAEKMGLLVHHLLPHENIEQLFYT